MTLTINFSHPLVAGGAALLALMFVSWLIYLTLPEAEGKEGPLHKLRAALGMERLPHALILSILALYIALAGILILGLFGLIVDTLRAVGGSNDYLFYVLRIGGLTAVLGAVIALPLTVIRLRLTQESLFNDKINEATKGLYARRQVTKWHRKYGYVNHWQDDIVQRNAAIDRLEGLAHEKPTEVPRIARLLSVYVRELSAEVPAQDTPKDAKPGELWEWAQGLPKLRSDMEKAAQTLGRLADVAPEPLTNGEIDLRSANLQRADLTAAKLEQALLREAHLQGANLDGAHLQGANLYEAQLQGANLDVAQLKGANLDGAQLQEAYLYEAQLQRAYLDEAQLQGARLYRAQLQEARLYRAQLQGAYLYGAQLQEAYLYEAQLQEAYLDEAQLQGANLDGAQLQGAYLDEAQFDAATSLTRATLRGARVREVDFNNLTYFAAHLDDVFADATATPPDGARPRDDIWPEHWAKEQLDHDDFDKAWRTWQATLPPD
ncbi:pentapeptide repeat-containing protein [uncultured Tateyamaria sp.]|uniref:pentapeptide repeat-containing protein n=1 Tax=uncultured Tateyamaria sp. TaxID=455651 RepID=UPI00262C5EC5|nr:pentapeptide repeat-containing protein [uncultured Tateyamaria sp.]